MDAARPRKKFYVERRESAAAAAERKRTSDRQFYERCKAHRGYRRAKAELAHKSGGGGGAETAPAESFYDAYFSGRAADADAEADLAAELDRAKQFAARSKGRGDPPSAAAAAAARGGAFVRERSAAEAERRDAAERAQGREDARTTARAREADRRRKSRAHLARTPRGQPIMEGLMNRLLKRIEKDAAPESAGG